MATVDKYEALIQTDRIHGSLYTDEKIFDEEMEAIFYRSWVFVGHASELPNVGDYLTRDIGRRSVIMARDQSGGISVMANRCQHRGNMLCNQSRGNARNFACPYHGWIYDLQGNLLDVPYRQGFKKDFANMGLETLKTESYRGFVFSTFNHSAIPFADYLGRGFELIDRACDLSPEGEIVLDAGWMRHHFDSNWKMMPENDTDGYHVSFTHRSMMQSLDSQYDEFAGEEAKMPGEVRDWGNGHTEIDFTSGYKRPLDWLGTTVEKVPDYVHSLEQAYGSETAKKRLFNGPPHAAIFPNLFLGEMNIVIFQPVSANTSIQWATPMFLKGARELDFRLLRQCEGALGPSSFLLADDASIAERSQKALLSGTPWCDLSRGLEREKPNDDGVLAGHMTDETSNRGFWTHYKQVMTAE